VVVWPGDLRPSGWVGSCSPGFPRSCRSSVPSRGRGQAGAPAAAQRRGRTSLTPV